MESSYISLALAFFGTKEAARTINKYLFHVAYCTGLRGSVCGICLHGQRLRLAEGFAGQLFVTAYIDQ